MKLLSYLTITILLACSKPKSTANTENLQKEVFAIHDEVMPRSMKAEDLMATISEKYTADSSLKAEGLAINSQLKAASDSMYVWMGALAKADSLEGTAKEAYLILQKTNGNKIKIATEAAIANAEKFIK
jgi:hypothetical protein